MITSGGYQEKRE
jgi:hypothetical protein